MRKEKALISLLKELVDLISEEAAQNPEFARKLELLLSPLPAKKLAKRKPPAKASLDLPDVYREYNARGQAEFRGQPCARRRMIGYPAPAPLAGYRTRAEKAR